MKPTTTNNGRLYPLGNSFGDVKKFLNQLKGEHNIMDLVELILKANNNDDYLKKLKRYQTTSEEVYGREYDPKRDIMIVDAWTDIDYQRPIAIMEFIKWLDAADGICQMSLSVICSVKRADRSFVYDGCHRSVMAALTGMKWLEKKETIHPAGMTREEMREFESRLFVIMNASKRTMKAEEIWKAEVVSKVDEALKVKKFLERANLDVLGVCHSDYHRTRKLNGFVVFKDMVTESGGNSGFCANGNGNPPTRRVRKNDIVSASLMISKIWPNDSTTSAYIIGGLASLLHPDFVGGLSMIEMEEIIYDYVNKRKPKTTQTDLAKNRLSGLNIESVGVRVGYNILGYDYDELQQFYGLDDTQMKMLVDKDEGDSNQNVTNLSVVA